MNREKLRRRTELGKKIAERWFWKIPSRSLAGTWCRMNAILSNEKRPASTNVRP